MPELPPTLERARVAIWKPYPLAMTAGILLALLLITTGLMIRNYSVAEDMRGSLQEERTLSSQRQDALDESSDQLRSAKSRIATFEQQADEMDERAAELEATASSLETREAALVGAEAEAAKNEFGDGLHVVGSTVNPGTYSTAGSTRSGCYYAWMAGTGADADIIDNNIINGPGVVTLNAGDIFESSGCQRWTKNG